MPHNKQVMRNEQVCQAQFLLQLVKHIDDLRLNGNIQCRDRFVTDDEIRIDGQRTGDTDTLSLSAGKLMRIAGSVLGIQSDVIHQLQDAFSPLFFCLIQFPDIQRLADDIRYRHTRIQ